MAVSDAIIRRFPKLAEADLRRLLDLPRGKSRVILDTDAANEIDDQFAIASALLSPEHIELEGVTIEPFSFQHKRQPFLDTVEIVRRGGPRDAREEALVAMYGSWVEGHRLLGRDPHKTVFVPPDEGMELSYQEALRVFAKVGVPSSGMVLRGAPKFLTSLDTPLRTPSAERIIERAHADPSRPLYVCAIGCLTNVASALLLDPSIISNIVTVWTAGYPTSATVGNQDALNMVEDRLAAQLLFACGAAHVYLPGFHVGAQLRISRPEMHEHVRGRGAIGDYLYHLFTHNPLHEQRAVMDRERRTWIIWDIINIAWLINPAWVPSVLVKAPLFGDDMFWHRRADGHLMREAFAVDRDSIFIDLFDKLDRAASR